MPVSYTHLDVYKRQVVSNNARSQGTTDVGKNKAGDAHSSDFTINATKAEYEALGLRLWPADPSRGLIFTENAPSKGAE